MGEGLIDDATLGAALARQAERGGRLGTQLLMMGVLDEETLAAFLSRQLRLPALRSLREVEPAAIRALPAAVARELDVLPVRLIAGRLWVAMTDPSDEAALAHARQASGLPVSPMVAPELLVGYGLRRFYPEVEVSLSATGDVQPMFRRAMPTDLEPF